MQQQQHVTALPPKPRRSRSAKRAQRSTSAERPTTGKNAREIYNQPPVSFNVVPSSTASRRRSSSLNKQKKQRGVRRRKGAQPGQGNSVMLNNYFPALTEQQESMSHEELAALQMQQAMLLRNNQDPNVVINEAMPEEEEGESQEVTHSRKMTAGQTAQFDAAPGEQEVVDEHDEILDDDQPLQQQVQIGLTEDQLMELLQNAD